MRKGHPASDALLPIGVVSDDVLLIPDVFSLHLRYLFHAHVHITAGTASSMTQGQLQAEIWYPLWEMNVRFVSANLCL